MRLLSLDLETVDKDLKKLGCGAHRADSRVLTMCARTFCDEDDVFRNYIDIDVNIMRDLINNCDAIVGSNIQYDLAFLDKKMGIAIPKEVIIIDVLAAERFIDTISFKVNLDLLAKKYLGREKISGELDEWAKQHKIKDYMSNLDKLPADMVSKYCLYDCLLALDVWLCQRPILAEHYVEAFDVELGVQRVIYEMTRQGVPFDTQYSKQLEAEMINELKLRQSLLEEALGTSKFKTKEGKRIVAAYCDKVGISYNLTTKKQEGQFNAEFYTRNANDEQLRLITEYIEIQKLQKDFVTKMRTMVVDDKLYPAINSMKGEQGGAITGRFSMSKPNIQQLPSRNPEWASKIRGQFRAHEDFTWVKADYSQQEMRLLFEFASRDGGRDAKRMVEMYQQDYSIDCYQLAVKLCADKGFTIDRNLAKKLMLATMYCMGPNKLAGQLGCGEEEAKETLVKFRDVLPFLRRFQRGVINMVEDRANKSGEAYVETIAGRKVYIPIKETEIKDSAGVVRGRAMVADGAYRGINYLIQGSAADIMKRAMVEIHRDLGITAYMSVHDELDFIIPKEEVTSLVPKIAKIMENTYFLSIPMLADFEIGNSWGELTEYEFTREAILSK
jgi:DNA polymerase I-like protein with 3'-5' exonuclease and polymerase domains